MGTQYKVVFTGRIREGFTHEEVVANLSSQTNLDEEKAKRLLAAEKPTLIKKDADPETAEKYPCSLPQCRSGNQADQGPAGDCGKKCGAGSGTRAKRAAGNIPAAASTTRRGNALR